MAIFKFEFPALGLAKGDAEWILKPLLFLLSAFSFELRRSRAVPI
jgi:hypothetical protein